jgi:uncharacterized cupin superfamily protein
MSNVVNIGDVALTFDEKGDRFASHDAQLGPLIGARDLGCTLTVVPPGKRSCPFHSHRANEEMFLILDGRGTLRYGATERPVRAGDLIACPTGGVETAHQLVNTSDAELRYLAFSTKRYPEIVEYPDSDKVLSYDGKFGIMVRRAADVDYWDGEV